MILLTEWEVVGGGKGGSIEIAKKGKNIVGGNQVMPRQSRKEGRLGTRLSQLAGEEKGKKRIFCNV